MKLKSGIQEKNIILKCGADALLPFAIVFGIYVILFGTVSPGGGFQGGVIVACCSIWAMAIRPPPAPSTARFCASTRPSAPRSMCCWAPAVW